MDKQILQEAQDLLVSPDINSTHEDCVRNLLALNAVLLERIHWSLHELLLYKRNEVHR